MAKSASNRRAKSAKGKDPLGIFGRNLLRKHEVEIKKALKMGELAGGSAVAFHRGQEVYRFNFGKADMESKVPFTPSTICRVYCMSKAYLNLTAMLLVQNGRLDLNAPVHKFIPSMRQMKVLPLDAKKAVAPKKTMTVWNLLTHSAGFAYGQDFNYPAKDSALRFGGLCDGIESGRLKSLAAFCNELAKVPLLGQPGEAYVYGYSTDVLGRVLEVACGKTLDKVMKEVLFEPLGMVDTDFSVPKENLGRLGAVYGNAETWGNLHRDFPKAVPTASKPGLVRLDGERPAASNWAKGKVRIFSGGGSIGHHRGGLVSSVKDTEAFVRMLLADGRTADGRQLITPETMAFILKNRLVGSWKQEDTRWCLLGDLVKDGSHLILQQGGAGGNYWLIDRHRQIAVIYFLQQVDGNSWEDTGLNPKLADINEVMKTIADRINAKAKRRKSEKPSAKRKPGSASVRLTIGKAKAKTKPVRRHRH